MKAKSETIHLTVKLELALQPTRSAHAVPALLSGEQRGLENEPEVKRMRRKARSALPGYAIISFHIRVV